LSNIAEGGYYIAPAFMDKLVIHITKNFLKLPNIKVRNTSTELFLSLHGTLGSGNRSNRFGLERMLEVLEVVLGFGKTGRFVCKA
jgi:hypothetical protein